MESFLRLLPLLLVWLPLRAQAATIPKADLEGDVTNSINGRPVAGARIRIQLSNREPVYIRADEHGHFRLADLNPGFYDLSVDSPGYLRAEHVSVNLTIPRPGRGSGLIVSPPPKGPKARVTTTIDDNGAPHGRITVPLLAYAAIAGKVIDPYGMPAAQTTMQLLSGGPPSMPAAAFSSASPIRQVGTDDKGEYRIGSLEPGTYYLLASRVPSFGIWEQTFRPTYYGEAVDIAAAKRLVVGPGDRITADIQIVRKAGMHVAGRLIEPAGAVPAGARIDTVVTLTPDHSRMLNLASPFARSQDEDYRIDEVLPGKYLLTAVSRNISADPFGANQNPIFGMIREIEVGDTDMDRVDLELRPIRDLTGRVTFDKGCEAIPMRVQILGLASFTPGQSETTTDEDGNFVLHAVPPGRYMVSAYPDSEMLRGTIPSVISMRQGQRNLPENAFDAPWTGDDPLEIVLGCKAQTGAPSAPAPRRPQ